MDTLVDYKVETFPRAQRYEGEFVVLTPLDPEEDAPGFFEATAGSDKKDAIWRFIPIGGPFRDVDHAADWLRWCSQLPGSQFLMVRTHDEEKIIGMVSFLNIVPRFKTLELGFIMYSPVYQRTKVNTESIYLMLCEAFDHLGYRRVEWKTDSRNISSQQAALRLGFEFEAVFKKHMLCHGENRDSCWYAMFDDDWARIKANMRHCLYVDDSVSLAKLNGPKGAEKNKLVVKRYIEEVISTGDTSFIDEFIAEEFVDKYSGDVPRGIEDARQHVMAVRSTYPDLKVQVLEQYTDKDMVFTSFIARATHQGEWLGIKPTNRKIEIKGINVDRVSNGKIVEHDGFANTFEALVSIQALPGVG